MTPLAGPYGLMHVAFAPLTEVGICILDDMRIRSRRSDGIKPNARDDRTARSVAPFGYRLSMRILREVQETDSLPCFLLKIRTAHHRSIPLTPRPPDMYRNKVRRPHGERTSIQLDRFLG